MNTFLNFSLSGGPTNSVLSLLTKLLLLFELDVRL